MITYGVQFLSQMRRSSVLLIASIVIFVAIIGGSLFVSKTSAQFTPFGGMSYYVFYCTCTGNIAVHVGPPNPAIVLFQPGASQLFQYYQIYREGVWVLGNYSPGGNCQYYVGKSCASYTVQGQITIVGTSL